MHIGIVNDSPMRVASIASVVVSVVGGAAAAAADAHRHTATGAASCTAPSARRAPLILSRAS